MALSPILSNNNDILLSLGYMGRGEEGPMPARRAAAYPVSARRGPLALAQHATMMGHASSPVHRTMVRVMLWTGSGADIHWAPATADSAFAG